MVYTDKIILSTSGFCDIIDITDKVEEIVRKSKIKDGLVNVFIKGSTAALTTMEYEPNLVEDMKELIERLVPQNKSYHHNKTWGDDNGFSHLRASLFSADLTIPLTQGRLELGTWQQIVLCDFDNRKRTREVGVKILGE
jgi:secondary thiamine-phosphate synthase enzyme